MEMSSVVNDRPDAGRPRPDHRDAVGLAPVPFSTWGSPRRAHRARPPRFHPIGIEILALAGLVIVAAAFAVVAVLYARRAVAQSRVTHDADAERRLDQVRATEQEAKSVLLAAKEEAARRRDEAEAKRGLGDEIARRNAAYAI